MSIDFWLARLFFPLGFSEIFRIFLTAEFELTRGSYGLKVPLLFDGNKIYLYYLGFGLLFISLLTLSLILDSRIGLFLQAMREDEDGAATRGVNTVYYRLYAFVVTSAFAGLAGGYYAHMVGLVSPRMSLISEMGLILAMGIFGGLESLLGAALVRSFCRDSLNICECLRSGAWRFSAPWFCSPSVLHPKASCRKFMKWRMRCGTVHCQPQNRERTDAAPRGYRQKFRRPAGTGGRNRLL